MTSDRQRDVIKAYLDGKSPAQIAAAHECSENRIILVLGRFMRNRDAAG